MIKKINFVLILFFLLFSLSTYSFAYKLSIKQSNITQSDSEYFIQVNTEADEKLLDFNLDMQYSPEIADVSISRANSSTLGSAFFLSKVDPKTSKINIQSASSFNTYDNGTVNIAIIKFYKNKKNNTIAEMPIKILGSSYFIFNSSSTIKYISPETITFKVFSASTNSISSSKESLSSTSYITISSSKYNTVSASSISSEESKVSSEASRVSYDTSTNSAVIIKNTDDSNKLTVVYNIVVIFLILWVSFVAYYYKGDIIVNWVRKLINKYSPKNDFKRLQ